MGYRDSTFTHCYSKTSFFCGYFILQIWSQDAFVTVSFCDFVNCTMYTTSIFIIYYLWLIFLSLYFFLKSAKFTKLNSPEKSSYTVNFNPVSIILYDQTQVLTDHHKIWQTSQSAGGRCLTGAPHQTEFNPFRRHDSHSGYWNWVELEFSSNYNGVVFINIFVWTKL